MVDKIEQIKNKINVEKNNLEIIFNNISELESERKLITDNMENLYRDINSLEDKYNRTFFNIRMRTDIKFKVLMMINTILFLSFVNNLNIVFFISGITLIASTVGYCYWVTRSDSFIKIFNSSELLPISEEIKSKAKELKEYKRKELDLYDNLIDLKASYHVKSQILSDLQNFIDNELNNDVYIEQKLANGVSTDSKPLVRTKKFNKDK